MISGYMIAIFSIVAIVVIAGVTYLVVTGKKKEKIDQTKVTARK